MGAKIVSRFTKGYTVIRDLIDTTNACVLLALEELFDYTADLSFLVDYFIENGSTGIPFEHMYLIPETVPVVLIGTYQDTNITISSKQTERYVIILDWKTELRYRIAYTQKIVISYKVTDDTSHFVCIAAHQLLFYAKSKAINGIVLKNYGLLVDHKLECYSED